MHDRYANIQITYLLQKIEEDGGIVVLTTNIKGAIDGLFQRRIDCIGEFPAPQVK